MDKAVKKLIRDSFKPRYRQTRRIYYDEVRHQWIYEYIDRTNAIVRRRRPKKRWIWLKKLGWYLYRCTYTESKNPSAKFVEFLFNVFIRLPELWR